jgi:hypothetical protein
MLVIKLIIRIVVGHLPKWADWDKYLARVVNDSSYSSSNMKKYWKKIEK